MRTDPINSENRNFSVPKAGALGALAGYAATYAVPLTTEEHANFFTNSVKNEIKGKGTAARAAEIKNIEGSLKGDNISPLVKDVFEKSKSVLEIDPKGALKDLHNQEIEKSAKKTLTNLFKKVKNSGNITEMKETAATSLAIKKENRAALYYAVIGAFTLMSVAVLKNALNTFFPAPVKKEAQKPVGKHKMTDLDYIINCAEGPASIYIAGFGKNGQK